MSLRRILICSVISPNCVGGLSAYQRELARALSGEGITGEVLFFNDLEEEPPPSPDACVWPATRLPHPRAWHLRRRLLMSLSSRPATFRLLEWMASRLIHPRMLAHKIASAEAVHFVGTGWKHVGLSILHHARRLGTPITIWPAVHPHSWGDSPLDIFLFNSADKVFCQSDFEAAHLIERNLAPDRIIRCGLPPMCRPDGDGSSFRKLHGLGEAPVALFLGRRDAGKGFPALLEAWPKVLSEHPSAKLILAGPPDAASDCVIDSRIQHSLVDVGTVDEKTKADALDACDLFVLPSAHESFGIVYIEAWSYRKPVICGTAPASRELVRNGETGLWGSQNPAVLAAAIDRLLSNPEERHSMGEAGYQTYLKTYHTSIFRQKHQETWNQLRRV